MTGVSKGELEAAELMVFVPKGIERGHHRFCVFDDRWSENSDQRQKIPPPPPSLAKAADWFRPYHI